MGPTVTLETKCWERDWRLVLDENRMRLLAERNAHPFTERALLINNVKSYAAVCKRADAAVRRGWLSRYTVVEDHVSRALRHFSLTRKALGHGFVYSIAELVGLLTCTTEFLVHYASDCMPMSAAAGHDWVARSIALMAADARVKTCNLLWDGRYEHARSEASEEVADFFLGFGFSDQCYLVRVDDFRRPIYNETHPDSGRYPDYGGELFEKRVYSWMRNHGHLRASFKHAGYVHEPAPLLPGERPVPYDDRAPPVNPFSGRRRSSAAASRSSSPTARPARPTR